MDQRNVRLRAKAGQDRRSVPVGAIGGIGVGLGRIHRGVGGGIHHQARRDGPENGGNRFRPVEIEHGTANDAGPRKRAQGRGKLAAAAGDEDRAAQSGNNGGRSRSRGKILSLSDRMTWSGETGQSMPISGSFQITPRSADRSQGPVTL